MSAGFIDRPTRRNGGNVSHKQWARRIGITLLSISLLGTSVAVTPASAATAPPPKPPAKLTPVGGHDVTGRAGPRDTTPSLATAPAVTWPSTTSVDVDPAAAGAPGATGLPVGVRRAGHGRMRVQVLDRDAARRAGRELLVSVTPADSAGSGPATVSIDYRKFRDAYGAGWPHRLRLVSLPECALRTPEAPACRATDLAATNDLTAGVVSAAVPVAAANQRTLVALASGPSSDGGSYQATSVKPTGTWESGSNSGDFTWQYPLRMPPSLGGPTPEVGLSYSTQSLDGQTAAANSQPSWAGEGLSYEPGFIERSYRSCKDDGQTGLDDQCWAGDNATMSLGGHTTPLLWNSGSQTWVPKSDDGARVERLRNGGLGNGDDDGEYWKVTTTDGMQYFFGLHHLPGWQAGNPETNSVYYTPVFGNNTDEPCNRTSGFAASSCQQAYRWNLDYVLDPHGNSMSYFYDRETNKYGRNRVSTDAVTYVRGGWLKEIDYGTRQDGGVDSVLTGTAPQRVRFDVTDRCVTPGATCALTAANANNWPDVPVDLVCGGSSCPGLFAPTYFTQKKLSAITTEVATGTRTWRRVEQWRLTHAFKSPGDGNQNILWLSQIDHCGADDNACMPATTFVPTQLSNRVDAPTGTASIIRYRISAINTDTGGTIALTYSSPECSASNLPASPDTNTKRCFPVWWTPPGSTSPKMEYFHRYLVTAVATADNVGKGDDMVEYFHYLGTPAWHFADDPMAVPARRTWGEWRGYPQVEVVHGRADQTQSRTVTTFFRGLNGDRTASGTRSVTVTDSDGGSWADDDWLAGQQRESIRYLGTTSTVVSKVRTDPYHFGPTATYSLNGSTATAHVTAPAVTTTTTMLDAGRGSRKTRTTIVYVGDRTGRVTRVDDEGDLATTADDKCTRTTYAENADRLMLTYIAEVETVAVRCAATPDRSRQVISDVRTWYDNATAFGAPIAKGDPTRTERLADFNGGNPRYQQDSRAGFDGNGRQTASWDAMDRGKTIAYEPAAGPLTRTTTRNDKGWTSTVDSDPAWGLPTVTVDENGKRTVTEYDGLGRLANVWQPGRVKGADSPTLKYAYGMHNTGAPNSVKMSKINPAGTGYLESYLLYDGLGRLRQSQAPAIGGGRMITETKYDGRGLAVLTRPPFYDADTPGTTLRVPNDTEVPAQTLHLFDGAERLVADIFQAQATEKWRTTTSYAGDRVDITEPAGGTATSTYLDAQGLTTEIRQYNGNTPTGGYVSTRYTYTASGQLATVTDQKGNVWTTTYDQLGQKTKAEDPDLGKTGYTYYADGQVKTSTDARGSTLAYEYDDLGRLTGRYSGAVGGAQLAAWTYDTVARNKLSTSTRYDGAGQAYVTTVRGYNDTYQVTDSSVTVPATPLAGALAGTYVTHTDYNADGSPRARQLPHKSGTAGFGGVPDETLTFGYTDQAKATTLTGLSSYVTDVQYEQNGQLSLLNLSDGGKNLLQYWTYEPGTLRPIGHQVLGDFGSNVVATDVATGYDNAGNVVSIKDRTKQYGGPDDDNQCFRYGPQRRLAEAWTPAGGDCSAAPTTTGLGGPAAYWTSYQYDEIGNRTKTAKHATAGDTTSTYAYPASGANAVQPHAITSVTLSGAATGSTTFAYDEAGSTTTRNIAGRPGQALTWDAEGHAATVTDTTGTASYLYDVDGNRLIGKDATGTTLYLGSTEYKVPAANGTVACTRYYYHASGGLVAVRTPAGLFWQTSDAQGTTQLSFRSTDLSRTQRRTDPFGAVRGSQPAWQHSHGFVGGTVDPTGLVHLGAREYDPGIGRFVSVDPVILLDHPETLNPYGYSGDNPVTYSDPSGENWLTRHLKQIGETANACINTTTLAGIGLMVLGTMIDGGGGLLAVTGVGAIVGLPAIALGTELIAAGATLTVAGVALGIANSVASNSGGGGDSSAGDSSSSQNQPYRYEDEKTRLKTDHPGDTNGNPLSDRNAIDALERDKPAGTEPKTDPLGSRTTEGGDVKFTDSNGNVVLRREVKTVGEGEQKTANAIETGARQVYDDGEVLIQVPEGTTAAEARAGLRKFQTENVNRNRNNGRDFSKVRVRIVTPKGDVLVDQSATAPVADPPPPNPRMGHSHDLGGT
jgi:RHS repeat-associated protein